MGITSVMHANDIYHIASEYRCMHVLCLSVNIHVAYVCHWNDILAASRRRALGIELYYRALALRCYSYCHIC